MDSFFMTGMRKAGKKYYVIPVMTSGRNMSYGSFGEQCREHHGGSGNGWNIDY
jgi:hypothetical protein